MNKIFRIVWSEVSQAWVAVSELTKSHKKRASATVATAILATALSATVQASESASNWGANPDNPSEGYTPPRPTNIAGPDGNDLNGLGFGLVVVDKDGKQKEIKEGVKINDENTSDDDKISTVITVEPNNDSAPEPPKNVTSYLYLVEGDGVTIDQTGRSAKFSVNTGDGLKIDDNKVAADTVDLTVADGKVGDISNDDDKKLVNAGNLKTTLNDLGWKVSADGGAASTVKSGEEVEFKGEGGITVTATTDTNGKHIVTINAGQSQGGSAAGGSTPVTAGNGISVDAATNKVSVNAKTNGGIEVDDKGVSVKAKANGGLAVDTDGVSVKTDGKTIEVDTDGKVTAKVASAKGLEKTDDGLAIKSKTNGGLTVDADGVSVNAKANGGLTVDGSGVSVNTDGTTITVDTATGNVKAVTGGFKLNTTTGATEANDNDGNKLATVTNVANAINAAKVKVAAGNGAEVAHNAATNTYTVSAKVEGNKGLENKTEGLSVKAGEGVTVDDKGVSVKSKANGGISVGADGVSVNANTNGGIKVDANGVSVNAKNNGGIKVDGDGVSVDVDGKTIEVGTDGKVAAKVASAKGLEKTDDGLAIKSKTNGGLTVDADGVSVNAKANGGLTVDGSGVSVNTDGTTITVDTATGNVKAVTGGFKLNTTTGATEANDNDGNKLATVTNVANAINDAKVKVEAGSGISVEHNPVSNAYTVSAPFEKTENDKGTTVTFKGKTTTEHPNGETKLSGIAAGEISATSTDAINGSQLYSISSRLGNNMNSLNDRINKVGKRADAGTASAIATANLLQSYRPGLSAATAAVGQYRGQSAIAVGYSRLSDNGKYGVKFSLGANTQGNVGAGAGVAYFW